MIGSYALAVEKNTKAKKMKTLQINRACEKALTSKKP
jgi:hypothetical protein